MANTVNELMNKTVYKCPKCGSEKTEVMESRSRKNWSQFILMILFTFGDKPIFC